MSHVVRVREMRHARFLVGLHLSAHCQMGWGSHEKSLSRRILGRQLVSTILCALLCGPLGKQRSWSQPFSNFLGQHLAMSKLMSSLELG